MIYRKQKHAAMMQITALLSRKAMARRRFKSRTLGKRKKKKRTRTHVDEGGRKTKGDTAPMEEVAEVAEQNASAKGVAGYANPKKKGGTPKGKRRLQGNESRGN